MRAFTRGPLIDTNKRSLVANVVLKSTKAGRRRTRSIMMVIEADDLRF